MRHSVQRAFLWTLVVTALAFSNAASLRAHSSLDNMGTSRRYWEDMTVAFSRYETRDWGPTQTLSIDERMARHVAFRLRELLPRAAERADLRPWEFWKTVQIRSFVQMAPFELRFSDDTGRARLSSLGFAWLGGIAPYLPLWLPFLAFVLVAFWLMVESFQCREGGASVAFLLLLASSAYWLEALTLPYSAVGFHLVSALAIVPLALFAFGPAPTTCGVWLRAAMGAAVIHWAAWCRSSSIIFLPAASVLLLIALFRSQSTSSRRRPWLLALALVAGLVAPKALAPKQAHELWVGMWEGLGDFDREYGHEWSDPAARVVLDAEGHTMVKRGPYWTEETEAIFRRLVLRDVRNDPVWYARILGQRVVATITQERLRPTALDSGLTYTPAQHPGEGFMDTYYNFVKTADVFVFFGATREVPLWLFWLIGLAFLVRAVVGRRERLLRPVGLIAAFALSALLLPVAVTTASGIETQVFVLSYLLCAAFLVAEVIGELSRFVGSRRRKFRASSDP